MEPNELQVMPPFCISKFNHAQLFQSLNNADSIEDQFLLLRSLLALTQFDIKSRVTIVRNLLHWACMKSGMLFSAVPFGSSVNGLGFRDSDIDVRLSYMVSRGTQNGNQFYVDENLKPELLSHNEILRVLKKITYAYVDKKLADGFVCKGKRCPVGKLEFLAPKGRTIPQVQGIKIDLSVEMSECDFGPYNSEFVRFLCELEPKFQLLGFAMRRWSQAQQLIVPGCMSSYALTNMLIHFCQIQSPPLLPTVDLMRDIDQSLEQRYTKIDQDARKLWNFAVCQDVDVYRRYWPHFRRNNEPLMLLFVKFFEFLLQFPYRTHILTIRPGQSIAKIDFDSCAYFARDFKLTPKINIQDPFDLSHNLVGGMTWEYFKTFLTIVRATYEKACSQYCITTAPVANYGQRLDWGLTCLLRPMHCEDVKLLHMFNNEPVIVNENNKERNRDQQISEIGSEVIPVLVIKPGSLITDETFIYQYRINDAHVLASVMVERFNKIVEKFVRNSLFSEDVKVTTYQIDPYSVRVCKQIDFVDNEFYTMQVRPRLRKLPILRKDVSEDDIQQFFKDALADIREQNIPWLEPITQLSEKVTVYILCDWRYFAVPMVNLIINHNQKNCGWYERVFQEEVTILSDGLLMPLQINS